MFHAWVQGDWGGGGGWSWRLEAFGEFFHRHPLPKRMFGELPNPLFLDTYKRSRRAGNTKKQDFTKTLTKTFACKKSCNGSYAPGAFAARSLGDILFVR
jgi:hypothetical protein